MQHEFSYLSTRLCPLSNSYPESDTEDSGRSL